MRGFWLLSEVSAAGCESSVADALSEAAATVVMMLAEWGGLQSDLAFLNFLMFEVQDGVVSQVVDLVDALAQ